MLYTRAWGWISQYEAGSIGWMDALEELDHNELLVALMRTIKHFEIHEEFERCAFLNEIKKSLKKA